MTPIVANLGIRLGRALGFEVEDQYFNEDAAWTLVAKLEEFTNEKKTLDPNVLHLCEELAMALNVRGGDESRFFDALEAQLGQCPFPVETIVSIVRYVRSQLHFVVKKKPVALHMPDREHVPLKSIDFGAPKDEDE